MSSLLKLFSKKFQCHFVLINDAGEISLRSKNRQKIEQTEQKNLY
jgi:hypothetical protein